MPDDPIPPTPDPSRRRPYLREPFEHRMDAPAKLIEAFGKNDTLRDGLGTVNVKQDRMDALAALLAPVREGYGVQAAAYRAVGEAAEVRDQRMEEAEDAYAEVFDRAKAAGRADTALREALDVGARERNAVQRLEQMGQFIDAAEAHAAALGEYGVKAAHLADARSALAEAGTARQTWDRLDVEAQHATEERDEAMGPLDEAMRDLQERGKAAFGDDPQMLEFLGLRPQ